MDNKKKFLLNKVGFLVSLAVLLIIGFFEGLVDDFYLKLFIPLIVHIFLFFIIYFRANFDKGYGKWSIIFDWVTFATIFLIPLAPNFTPCKDVGCAIVIIASFYVFLSLAVVFTSASWIILIIFFFKNRKR